MCSLQRNNPSISLFAALIPLLGLIIMLAFNVFVFGDNAIEGSNQFILLLGGVMACIVGYFYKIPFSFMIENIATNIKSVSGSILILLLVGSLAASWLISGIIPAMIYYGIKLINPTLFLPTAVIISAIVSLATGSSWTTSATIGIALIAIGKAMDISAGMVAGAVISGAYFGDKLSPLSDTTNLASAMSGASLFDHIRYMLITTVPSLIVTLIVFSILSSSINSGTIAGTSSILLAIERSFFITPWLFIVPVIVIGMIIYKVSPLIALFAGTLLGMCFSIFFQPMLVSGDFFSQYKFILGSVTTGVSIESSHIILNDLFMSGGMEGMLSTIWLIICAMVFGGVMESIGALTKLSSFLLSIGDSIFSLFAATVGSCLTINLTASDQYLAIVVPGKMFSKAYKDHNLAPENLSRTLEDSGTVTSVLVPWNTCGAYQSSVLGVGVGEYFIYAIFNYVSPFMTLLFAAIHYKIKRINPNVE